MVAPNFEQNHFTNDTEHDALPIVIGCITQGVPVAVTALVANAISYTPSHRCEWIVIHNTGVVNISWTVGRAAALVGHGNRLTPGQSFKIDGKACLNVREIGVAVPGAVNGEVQITCAETARLFTDTHPALTTDEWFPQYEVALPGWPITPGVSA